MQQPLTQQQIESDLARLPPAAAGPVTTAAAASTRGVSELALVLLHQQCRALLAQEQKDAALEARMAQIRAELQSTQTKGESGETDDDSSAGARMADALEDEAEEPDKEAYLRVLKAQGVLPMAVRLPQADAVAGPVSSGSDGTEHQLIRDLERDQLELDGCGYKPGLGGYARVVQWLRGAMEARLQECLPAPGEAAGTMLLEELFGGGEGSRGAQAPLEAFAKELLRRINRTHSSGVSYERLTQALGVEGLTRIVPDSAAGAWGFLRGLGG